MIDTAAGAILSTRAPTARKSSSVAVTSSPRVSPARPSDVIRVVPPARLAQSSARCASDFEHGTVMIPDTGEPGRKPCTFSIGIGRSDRTLVERAADCSGGSALTYSLPRFA
jgi:hypothetical protein